MDLHIDGDAALVAASSSGLGKASARALAAEGANVVVNGRDQNALDDAVADLADEPGTVVGHAADLTDPDAPAELVERCVEEFGGLDHLVTNAGGPPSGPFVDLSDEEWYDAYDLLVMSAVRLVRAAVPHLRASDGGTVVAIASRSVVEPIPSLALSNSVRGAIPGLAKTLSAELAPEVRVNTVLPGSTATDRVVEHMEAAVERGEYESVEAGVADWTEDIPLERLGRPEELGDAVAYLSSDRSSFVTGATLSVDGGQTHSTL